MKSRLGQILVENEYISEEQLQRALDKQDYLDKKLGQILLEMGYIDAHELVEILEFQLNIPQINIDDYDISPDLLEYIPENIARRYQAIPLEIEDNTLKVAMSDPTDLMALDDLEMISDCEIEAHIASADEIKQALEVLYSSDNDASDIFKSLDRSQEEEEPEIDELREMVEEAPIVQLTNIIINKAIKLGASDIHIEPHKDNVRVRNRIDGVLHENMTVPKHSQAALISRIKIMADLDITKRRIPQDGRVRLEIRGTSTDMRVSTLPTIYGEKIVIRLLKQDERLLNINNLGFSSKNLNLYKKLINRPHGIILATGPTGSGKTTTLFSGLNELNSPKKNIITIEDPVEYQIRGINQVQVQKKSGFGIAKTLRNILRQDPDIIMVGEIRDEETARVAIRAALTGHLVLSTLHTNDAVSSITRLIDMGIPSYLVASTLNGVIAQRLVRRICKECRESYEPSLEEKEALNLKQGQKLYQAQKCSKCGDSGFKGRLAVQEILVIDDLINKLIVKEADNQEIKQQAIQNGMIPLIEDGKQKVLDGLTSYQELMRVVI